MTERATWPGPGYIPERRYGQLRDEVQAGTRFSIEGQGPAVMLLHGVGLDLTMWDPLVARLSGDFTLIRYDFWGHGGSQKPLSPLRLSNYVSQLSDMVAYLRLERFALVGFSMGALIAQAYAQAECGRLARLCLMNAVYRRNEEQRAAVEARLKLAESEGPSAIIEPALERWLTPAFRSARPDAVAALRARLERNDVKGFLTAYRVFAESDRELAGREEAIGCPALVMTGELDRGSTPEMTHSLAGALPRGEALVLPGLAHLAPLEGEEAVTDALRRFLTVRCA